MDFDPAALPPCMRGSTFSPFLCAHAIAAAGNAGKVALMQGNPLAINQAQWIALLRYLAPTLRDWLGNAHAGEDMTAAGWEELLHASRQLAEGPTLQRLEMVVLGEEMKRDA